MSGRRAVAALVAVAVVVWGSSCSAPPTRASSPLGVCFGAPPAGWATTRDASGVRLPGGTVFGLAAVHADTAFGQYDSASGDGVGSVDLATGRFTRITAFRPGAGGLGALAADDGWVVWEQLDSAGNLADWSVHARNRRTGVSRELSTSRAAGGFVRGQQPLPVLRGGVAAWAQPVGDGPIRAEVRAVDLATGRSRTVAAGRVSSPVYAGRYLLWSRIGDGGEFSFAAVDAGTLAPAALPGRLGSPGTVGYLAGSAAYLAWSSADYTTLTVWRIGTGELRQYRQDGRHPFQFLQLAGRYLVWYTGTASSVLDLDTGHGFDVPGTAAGSADWIAAARPEGDRAGTVTSRLSRMATAPRAPVTARKC
jgi:hypothetical protein